MDDDAEPYSAQLEQALTIADSSDADDKAQRSALARIKRIRGRSPERGVSAFDFAAVPTEALRMYYNQATQRADATSDAELARLYVDPFVYAQTNIARHAELMARPYYLIKVNTSAYAHRPEGSTAFHMVRRSAFGKTAESIVPFEEGDRVTLFNDTTGVPVFDATVTAIILSETQSNPASGGLALALREWAAAIEGDIDKK